jgi:ABC-type transporter Mla MlaB component
MFIDITDHVMPEGSEVTISGRVTGDDGLDLELAILVAQSDSAGQVRLDFEDASVVDFAGLAILLHAASNVVSGGGSFPQGHLVKKFLELDRQRCATAARSHPESHRSAEGFPTQR